MHIDQRWAQLAHRAVRGAGVQPGELILVRDGAGRYPILQEVMLAIELAGATPQADVIPPTYLERLLREGNEQALAAWDARRAAWLHTIDRIISLGGVSGSVDFTRLPSEKVDTWLRAAHRLTAITEQRNLPFLLVAVPTVEHARPAGMSLASLEDYLLPALTAPAEELAAEIDRVLAAIHGARQLLLHSGHGHELHLTLADRPWHGDDGTIDERDRARDTVASNLPAGSVYTTVLERATEGLLHFPRAGTAIDVTLRFAGGRVTDIEAAMGAETLAALFDRHSGEPRRISHIGIGLNPYLRRSIGWTLVDEHIHGHLFVAFGENRYMGGENESSLNVDFSLPDATLETEGRLILERGQVVV